MTPIRVLLADDHAVVRQGIYDFLQEDEQIEVIAQAEDGKKAQAFILELLPDVAILDLRMPHITGIELTRWIREQGLAVRVLILTAYDDDPFILAALQAGANGYVLKSADAEQIVQAVHTVQRGEQALAADIVQKLVNHVTTIVQPAPPTYETITEREREVLQLAASGLTNRGIGLQLSISDRTVQAHLASIYDKLKVNSRTEAVTKALNLGVIQLSGKKP